MWAKLAAKWMFTYIQDQAHNVAFHTYFDSAGGGADSRIVTQPGGTPTQFPNAARRLKQYWGLPMPTRTQIGTITPVSTADGILVSGGGTGYKTGTTDTFYFTSRGCGATDSCTVKITAASVAAGQAGVMVRQGTGTGAVYGALEYSNGILSFRSRAAAGAGALGTTVSGVTLPVWLKLARNGNTVRGYRSSDGLNWQYTGSDSVGFTAATQIGVAVSSGDTTTLNVVEVDSLDNANLVMDQEISITNKIIKDNSDLAAITYTGSGTSWSTGTVRADKYLDSYRAASVATGAGSIVFNSGLTSSTAGLYDVYLHWPEGDDLQFDTPITVSRVGGNDSLVANQLGGHNEWVHAGTFDLPAGATVAVGNSLTPTYIGGIYSTADVVMFVPLSAPVNYEAETVSGITSSTGDAVSVFTETSASGGAGSKLASNAVNDFIQYPLTNVPAGTWTIKVRYKRNTTRGICQLSIDGVNFGAVVDEYGTGAYVETTVGTNKTLTAGTHNFRFTITGKNASSSGYDLTVDRITLEP